MRSIILEEKRQQALLLRSNGNTYSEIVNELGIAKSTLAGWVKDVYPPATERKIREIASKKYRDKINLWSRYRSSKLLQEAKSDQEKYAKDVRMLSRNDLFLVGTSLYWAEGGKTNRWSFTFYNSDPKINQIMMRFLREIYEIQDEKIRIQLILHANIEESLAKKYWAGVLKLDEKRNFNKATFSLSSASKGKRPKNRLPYGTVQIYVPGKEICNKIKGWMLGLSRQAIT